MSETSKTRHRVLQYCVGHGIDIGCADDKITPQAIGVDVRMLDGVDYCIDVRMGLPYRDGALDYVYSSHTLEDLHDTRGILAEWLRVLRPGGHLILYLPHRDWYPRIGHPRANKGHHHDFCPGDIEGVLSALGGTEIVVSESYGPPGGVYDYDRRGQIEYSFLLVARRLPC